MKTRDFELLIIGAGAAGLSAAVFAGRKNIRAAVICPDKPGHKLSITGKGRCNITNDCGVDTVVKNLYRGGKFMQSSLRGFSPRDVMDFFQGLGVAVKTERGNRVFPQSDKAWDVVDALTGEMKRKGIPVISEKAIKILTEEGKAVGVETSGGVYKSRLVLLATGGLSYPLTGSTGDGYEMAKKLGHTIIPPRPALVPLETCEAVSSAAGLELKNIAVSLIDKDGKKIYSELGEASFTGYGMTGPLILTASCFLGSPYEKYKLVIDFKPGLDEKKLDARLQRDFSENGKMTLTEELGKLLPRKIIPEFTGRLSFSPEIKVGEISRDKRREILSLLKKMPFNVKCPRPVQEAIITEGGIDLKEINPKTMESKLVKGLLFAGEILDVSGFTGGFNLQAAFSSAHSAVMAIDNY